MKFAGLGYIWIVAVAGFFLALGYFFQLKKQVQVSSWIDRSLWNLIIPEFSVKKFKLKWLFLGLGSFFVLLALLRPQWGEHEESYESRGMDIMFILDLSNSMLAEDVHPSRLSKSQLFIKKTMQNLQDDRVGIVGFAGSSFLAVPLTNDFDYVSEIVDSLNPSFILKQGTQISDAINVSLKAFERGGNDSRKTSRAMILISDGEDFGKDSENAGKKNKDVETAFFVLGVGSPDGEPIPIRNETGVLQTYKKDRSSKTVLSKPNVSLLQKIASSAGGKYFDLTNVDDAAYVVSKQLSSLHRESMKEQKIVTKIDRFQIFLAIGIFFISLGYLVSYRKIRPFGLVFALLVFPSSHCHAQGFEAYWKNRKGIREYDVKNYENSARIFEDAKKKEPDNSILEYNQATALAQSGKDDDAVFHFKESTKKSLISGDYETAAKSLYNEGLIHKKKKNYQETYHQLTNAIEMAKISNQPELEKKAREALLQSSQDQEQNKKDKNDQSKDQSNPSKENQPSQGGDPEKKENNKNSPSQEGGKREFKSGTLSKDVAEGIMNDLSDREKQLYQKKMKDKKPKEFENENDW